MNFKKLTLTLMAFAVVSVLLNSCKPTCEKNPDDPECIQNDEEVITTVRLTVRDSISDNIIGTYQWKDADGDGAGAPVIDQINLPANGTYKVGLEVLNEIANPAEDITTEIQEEANDHQFFYHAHTANVTISYDDLDTHTPPLPVGLRTIWKTGAASTGTVHLTLKHQPGIKDGNESTGDTDVDVEFVTVVQ